MTADLAALVAPIAADGLHLEPIGERHRAALGALCPADDPAWHILPTSYAPDRFDAAFDALLADRGRHPFMLVADGAAVGMSGYLNVDPPNRVLEIGGTYFTPSARGTGLNARIKRVLIARAFAAGFHRIEFRIDTRNTRSIAAVEKLGGIREGVLRRQRITWTGYVRDTAVYAILAGEWPRA